MAGGGHEMGLANEQRWDPELRFYLEVTEVMEQGLIKAGFWFRSCPLAAAWRQD